MRCTCTSGANRMPIQATPLFVPQPSIERFSTHSQLLLLNNMLGEIEISFCSHDLSTPSHYCLSSSCFQVILRLSLPVLQDNQNLLFPLLFVLKYSHLLMFMCIFSPYCSDGTLCLALAKCFPLLPLEHYQY